MSSFILALLLALSGLAAGAAYLMVRSSRQAVRNRRRTRAWDALLERTPVAPSGPGEGRHPLVRPEGFVTVLENGLALALRDREARPVLVPWEDIHHLDPSEPTGVRVYLAGGLHVTVSALVGREIWNRERGRIHTREQGPSLQA